MPRCVQRRAEAAVRVPVLFAVCLLVGVGHLGVCLIAHGDQTDRLLGGGLELDVTAVRGSAGSLRRGADADVAPAIEGHAHGWRCRVEPQSVALRRDGRCAPAERGNERILVAKMLCYEAYVTNTPESRRSQLCVWTCWSGPWLRLAAQSRKKEPSNDKNISCRLLGAPACRVLPNHETQRAKPPEITRARLSQQSEDFSGAPQTPKRLV